MRQYVARPKQECKRELIVGAGLERVRWTAWYYQFWWLVQWNQGMHQGTNGAWKELNHPVAVSFIGPISAVVVIVAYQLFRDASLLDATSEFIRITWTFKRKNLSRLSGVVVLPVCPAPVYVIFGRWQRRSAKIYFRLNYPWGTLRWRCVVHVYRLECDIFTKVDVIMHIHVTSCTVTCRGMRISICQ